MPLRKISAFILLIILLISPASVAKADLNASIADMFQRWGGRVNATNPGAYDAQTRGFIIGGSLSARVPSTQLQPISIKPPSIKAGCGGIDIFGGSFSYINADQLVNMLQAIGQNALGYAFSLGLEAVCPTCNSVIKALKDTMDKMNKFNMDSCMASKALVNTAGESIGLWNLESCKQEKGAGDPVTGWLECASGNEANVRQQVRQSALNKTTAAIADQAKGAPLGATTHQALQWTSLTADQRQQIMSVIGTWYSTGSDDRVVCKYRPSTLSLADLVHGGPVKLLKCTIGGLGDGEKCEGVQTEETTIEGFTKLVKDKMTGIMVRYRAGTALDDNEKAFVNAIPIPPVAYMLKQSLRYSEGLATALIDLTSEAAAASLAWHLIEEYLKAVETGQSNITACGVSPTDIAGQLRKIRQERQEIFGKYIAMFDAQIKTIQFMNSIDVKVAQSSTERITRAYDFATKNK